MLSFEPNPDGLRRLRRHFEANELADRIETLPCALSDGEGAMMLWDITEVTGMRGHRHEPAVRGAARAALGVVSGTHDVPARSASAC